MNDTSAKLDTASLRARLNGPRPPRLLDVRTPGEFAAAHIPGSYNVPLDMLREHRDELCRHLGEAVLICRSGGRAGQGEKVLAEAGLCNIRVLEGGITAWEAAGAPLNRDGRKRWDLERQIRLVAGTIVLAAVVGSVALPALKWGAAFVGAGLTFAALTNTCAMGMLLAKLPYNRGASCDLQTIMARLADDGRPA